MESDCTWITCEHVIEGSADHVKLQPHHLCLCSACVANRKIAKIGEVCILNQNRLEGSLYAIKQIDGLRYIGKYRDQFGNFATEYRRGFDRRSGEDCRLGGITIDSGHERRYLAGDRRGSDRRTKSGCG